MRNGAPKTYAAALFPQTSLRVRSTEDEDSPKGYRSPKPATTYSVAGRKALFAGAGGQLGFFRQTEPLKHKALAVLFFRRKRIVLNSNAPFANRLRNRPISGPNGY